MDPIYGLDKHEMSALIGQARGEDCRLYLALRRRADFKTGTMAHPSTKNLSLSSLARLLSLPASPGVPALALTHTDIRRGVQRLEALGLVDEIRHDGRALKLRLPLVANAAEKLSGQVAEKARRLSGNSQNQRQTETQEASAPSQEASINSAATLSSAEAKNGLRLSGNTFTESAEALADTGITGNRGNCFITKTKDVNTPCTQPKAKAGNDTSPSAPKFKTHHAPSALAKSLEKSDRFRAIMEEAGQKRLLWVDSLTSKRIYANWDAMGVSDADIRDAVVELLAHPERKPTPNGVDAIIRASRTPPPQTKPRTGRGKGDLVL